MSMTREEVFRAIAERGDDAVEFQHGFTDWGQPKFESLYPDNFDPGRWRLRRVVVPPGDLTWVEAEAARKAGKRLQYYNRDHNVWVDRPNHYGECCNVNAYRLKPTPRKVPLGPEDVPPGSVVRYRCGGVAWTGWFAVLLVSDSGIEIQRDFAGWQRLFDGEWQVSRDGGKTWQGCWKEAP